MSNYLTLSNYSWIHVYILTGAGYGTQTLLKDESCYSCGYWRTESIDLSAYKTQSVELKLVGYFGSTGVTNILPLVLFPGFTTVGTVGRNQEGNGNFYAALHSTNASLTSSPFTIDPTAQYGTVRIYGLATSGDAYTLKILSGPGYGTVTQVASGYGTPSAWVTVSFAVTSFVGQQVELQVIQTTYDIGVDDTGVMTIAVPNWTPKGNASEIAGGPTGQYLSTDNWVASSPFTIAGGEQQLTLSYKGGSASSSFYVKLLSGTNFATVTDLAGYVVADPNTWKTLKAAVNTFDGQQVELQIQQYTGTGLYDNAGNGEVTVSGWTMTSANPVATGADNNGNYVTPYNTGGTLDLRSAVVNPGIVVITSPSYRYYAISYDIGYSTGNLLQVTWTNTSNQIWVVFSDAANSPPAFTRSGSTSSTPRGQPGHSTSIWPVAASSIAWATTSRASRWRSPSARRWATRSIPPPAPLRSRITTSISRVARCR
jgi:hypothetical protein